VHIDHGAERTAYAPAVPPLLVVLIAIVGVGGMLLWMGALVDAAQYEDASFTAIGRAKRSTVLLVLFTWAFGGAWYWLRIKPRLRR
jgi:hypothetical protein